MFFSLFVSGLSSFSQGITRYTYHDSDKSKVKEIYSVKDTIRNVLEGNYLSFYLNGKRESKGTFKNNEPVGEWEFYYETGNLKMKMVVEGPNRGYWQYFYETGARSMEGLIEDNMRQGEWKIYFESGLLKREGKFEDNKRVGLWQTYYEDGKLKGEIEYKFNRGQYTEYYSSGEIRGIGPKSGLNNTGKWTYFYKEKDEGGNPKKEAEGHYNNRKKVGLWSYYHKNGELSSRGKYDNDAPEGEWEYYYNDGTLSSKGTFQEGKKNGSWNLYYPNGNLMGKGEYKDGTGPYEEYYLDNSIKIKGQFLNGSSHGKWLYYYQNGKLEGECVFNNGTGTYYGYYPDGTLRTKGVIKDKKRTGKWELYEQDGSLSGYYKPFYDDNQIAGNIMSYKPPQKSRERGIADYRYRKKGFKYFEGKINEFQGMILSINPLMVFLGKIPFGMEFYLQERLGHEFEFEGIRRPFFTADFQIPLNEVYSRGYSIALKQKFYNSHRNIGLWYFGHEIQFVNLGHYSNIQLPLVPDTVFPVNASEQKLLYHILLGYRIMESTVNKGFGVDVFGGIGSGYRIFNVDEEYADQFLDLPQNKFPISFRAGLNFSYTLGLGHWK